MFALIVRGRPVTFWCLSLGELPPLSLDDCANCARPWSSLDNPSLLAPVALVPVAHRHPLALVVLRLSLPPFAPHCAVAHVPLYDAGAIQQTVVVAPPDEATPSPVAGTGVTTGGGDHGLGVPSYFDGNTNVSPYTSDDEGTLIAASALRRGVRCGCCGLECCGLDVVVFFEVFPPMDAKSAST